MANKLYKPTSNGRRNMTNIDRGIGTKNRPEKSLLADRKAQAGRNNYGHITVRHQGAGVKRRYRLVDFKRTHDNVPAIVKDIQYDPNRTANIALIYYVDGTKSYILAPQGLHVGDRVESGPKADIKVGNALPLEDIPVGTTICNIEFKLGKGGQIARSAGTSAQLLGRQGKYSLIKLPSGEVRMILSANRAMVGSLSNPEHSLEISGTAGRSRRLGKRPHMRGVSLNPNDHPHGGGDSHEGVGYPAPLSPWHKKTVGMKTRSRKARSNKFIVHKRKQSKM